MDIALGLSTAGISLSALLLLLLLAGSYRFKDHTGIWMSLICLETLLFYTTGLLQALRPDSDIPRLFAILDGLYGLPALYLFTRSILDDPHPHPLRPFIPFLGYVGLSGLCVAWKLIDASASADLALDAIDALSWAGESVQLPAYGFMILKRLLEPRLRTPRSRQARAAALVTLSAYLALFLWIWLGKGIGYLAGLSAVTVQTGEYTGPAELAIGLAFNLLIGYVILSRPHLLHDSDPSGSGETDADRPVPGLDPMPRMAPEASDPEASERGYGKYRRTRLTRPEAEEILGRARAWLSLRKDLSPESVTPRRLASVLHIPYHRLSRAANELGGGGVLGLIVDARLERAASLLEKRPELGILDVALESGFPAKSSFNEAWRRKFGASPRDWRRLRGTEPR